MASEVVSIIALTETCLNVNDNDNFKIPGYISTEEEEYVFLLGMIQKLNDWMTLFLRKTLVKWGLFQINGNS